MCELTPEQFKEYRGDVNTPARSPFRDRPIEESLDLFARMRAGEFPNGAMTLRAKIDLASGNLNLRDPIIYRIRFINHHRQGTKWCIYPMYDFAHPIQDALEGITHSLCSLEFESHRPLYDWVVSNVSIPYHKPRQIDPEFLRPYRRGQVRQRGGVRFSGALPAGRPERDRPAGDGRSAAHQADHHQLSRR